MAQGPDAKDGGDLLYLGVDVGTSVTKAVLLDAQGAVRGKASARTGMDFERASDQAIREVLERAQVSSEAVTRIVACGYGRNNVRIADERANDLDCLARGAFHCFPRPSTVVDVGARDSTRIHLDPDGRRVGFTVNHNCAAGTGTFLEEIALRMDLPVEALARLAEKSQDLSVTLGSYCTVFAKGEILEKIRAGVGREDLARAAVESVARRVVEKDQLQGDVVATGGVVAHHPVFVEILAELLGGEVLVPPAPQFVGALGAALIARR